MSKVELYIGIWFGFVFAVFGFMCLILPNSGGWGFGVFMLACSMLWIFYTLYSWEHPND